MTHTSKFHSGDWVQVRSKEEILKTLDKNGQVDHLPFMPEMFQFCGQQFQVSKRAHKTCDPPNGILGRRMPRTVHLEGTRCNGDAHGGCQARCLLFWKDEWLAKIDGPTDQPLALPQLSSNTASQGCTEQDVIAGTLVQISPAAPPSDLTYICQSTQVDRATSHLPWWDVRQYIEDYTSGNVTLLQLLVASLFFIYTQVISAGIGLGSPLRWIYDTVQKARNATLFPMRTGLIAKGGKTPSVKLDLKPGELVKVRSYGEILETLTEDALNRGMYFDPEMVPFCGKTFRVLARVNTIVNEKTGKIQAIKNDCIILDEAVCMACYAKNRRFCPRGIYPYWREIWLERVGEPIPALK